MEDGLWGIALLDAAAREATLFAGIWFLVGALDDLAVDLLYAAGRLRRRSAGVPMDAAVSGSFAVFIPAWDEVAVIGLMLRAALARFDWPDYRLYVGTYPNDRATIAAVAGVAEADARVRLVIGERPGPTTKADCLNTLWRALLRDEAAGEPVRAIVLHDAEDVVHPAEFRVFAHYLEHGDAVQLPVLPLRHRASRLVSGHYIDEFCEAHGKTLPVRQALGAGLPFAGVGCAISREMLGRVARSRGGAPFDAGSLTEDYELGLTIAAMGGRTLFARVPERPGGPPVAVRAYFPATVRRAVRQKARWLAGIALMGWDRIGWSADGSWREHWMRVRDRRATLAMPVLAVAYCALLLWVMAAAAHLAVASPEKPLTPGITLLIAANLVLLAWRLAIRALFTGRAYGWSEALLSLPRALVSNAIALLAARRAALLYLRALRGGGVQWEKTAHQFPEDLEIATA